MRKFAYNYVDLDEATPRTEYHGSVLAHDEKDAAFAAWFYLFDDGSNCQVYNVIQIQD